MSKRWWQFDTLDVILTPIVAVIAFMLIGGTPHTPIGWGWFWLAFNCTRWLTFNIDQKLGRR